MSAACLRIDDASLEDLDRLAGYLSLFLRAGDFVALDGDLGAGKTTFARALISIVSAGAVGEVPSPTFTLVQSYDCGRLKLHHFDLYRLSGGGDLRELGLDAALAEGVALVEWPERLGPDMPSDRFVLSFAAAADPERRNLALEGHGRAGRRVQRITEMRDFTQASGFGAAMPAFLQGDASRRAYARLHREGQPALVLMDSPRRPEGEVVRDGKTYNQIAHLAEEVRPFVAIGNALRRAGLSAPEVIAHDFERGFLILEDLGDLTYGAALDEGYAQAELYRAATDILIEMRSSAARPRSAASRRHDLLIAPLRSGGSRDRD